MKRFAFGVVVFTKIAIVAFALLLAWGGPLYAQTTTGRITGTVGDQTGAVIPGVEITVRNPATGLSRTVISNDSGTYAVPLLPPAVYEVEVSLPGFRREVRAGITVQVDAVVRVDFALVVGQVSEVVEVTADAPLVQSETASLGLVMDGRKMTDIPLNARHVMMLTILTPGVMPLVEGSNLTTQNLSFHAMGSRERDNNFLLDGVSATDPGTQQLTITPSIDAVQEFKLMAGTYSAEFGRSGGGVLNIQTKSGTNAFHGTVFEFVRNDVFDARNFFAEDTPPLRRNQFGTVLTGPIKTDRAFFMFNYEGNRIRKTHTALARVPTDRQRSGDFSEFSKQLIDPITRTPFPGNVIPASRMDPRGRKIADFYPVSNRPTIAGSNYLTLAGEQTNFYVVTGRVDYRVSDRQNAFVRVAWQNKAREEPNFDLGSELPGFGLVYGTAGRNVAVSDTYVFGPRTVNEFRVGFNRLVAFIYPTQFEQDLAKEIGITGVESQIHPSDFGLGFPTTLVTGLSDLDNHRGHQGFTDNNWHFFDMLAVTRGNHQMKMGAEVQTLMLNVGTKGCPNGCFRFDGRYSGNALADLLLGYPYRTDRRLGFKRSHTRNRALNLFFQDDWKVTPELTLNLGLRYDLQTPPVDSNEDYAAFDSVSRQIVIAGKSGPQTFQHPVFPDQTITLAGGADHGIPRGLYHSDLNNYSPRFGLAWSPRALNIVLRAGYGIFVTPEIPNLSFGFKNGAYPWVIPETFIGARDTPNITLRDPFPEALARGSIRTRAMDINRRDGYVQHWNLGIQRQIGANMMLDVSYAGSKGAKILGSRNINRAVLGPGSVASRRPIPGWGSITQTERRISTSFHSLQAKFERRFSEGLTFVSAYTWSHAIDYGGPRQGGALTPQDDYNLRAERGNPAWDLRHRSVNSYSYELPIGSGKPLLGGVSGVASKFVSGWQIAGITTFSTGQTWTPEVAGDISLTGGRFVRPNRICDGMLPRGERGPARWIDKSCFVTPERGTFGNSGRGIMKAPGTNNWDITVTKNTPIGDRQRVEFRAEFFNAFNHPRFKKPVTRVNSPNFGTLTQAWDARQIQFGLKYFF